jgi:DNA-directed RNA polymerase sigma subunit (sigma70/sigma32)
MKEQERKEAFADGVDAGVAEANERVATDMLKEKLPLKTITKISKLSEERIRQIAKSIGVAVL